MTISFSGIKSGFDSEIMGVRVSSAGATYYGFDLKGKHIVVVPGRIFYA
jgi:hypothetical protein